MTSKLDDLVRLVFRKMWEPVCYICGFRGVWGKDGIQVGHYIARKVFTLRWDLKNLFPNCSTCNSRHEYYMEPFREAILKKEGIERLKYLDQKYQEHLQIKTLVKMKEKQELYEELTKMLNSS